MDHPPNPSTAPATSQRQKLDRWLRRALVFTGFLNLAAAVTFAPPFPALRAQAGFPEPGHPFYGWLVAAWIFFFGLAYLWLGFSSSHQRLFLAVGAAGKASFALLLIALSLTGDLPAKTPLAGLVDLLLAAFFVYWLLVTRPRAGEC
ncbi:MAG: hypothetical protein HC897_05920 [Thermoanaerobaculia bacterium]|nr:hypothetical protein [Thermoanaerobaculia bacterium]